MHLEKKPNHDPPFEIVEICILKKVKFKAPLIKSVARLFFLLNPVELRQSMSVYFGYQNFAKKTQCCRFVVQLIPSMSNK